jgi:hypothetical protein
MKKLLIIALLLTFTAALNAQNKVELFPAGLTVQPFTANTLEPKLGFLFHSSENELRLDIGNSMDFIRVSDDKSAYSFGADLFTYTRLRKEQNFHFPVDAVDYLFGVNAAYKVELPCAELGARLRLSHISAHIVDGHYDNTLQGWKDNHPPRVYSREFLELMPYIRLNSFRGYIGYTYIFHIDPPYIGKNNFQAGFDYYLPWQPLNVIHPYIGYDFKLIDIHSYTGNNSIVAGFKLGHKCGRGFSLYYQYYSGYSVHGEYFDSRVNYSAIGINLDL